MKPFDRKFLSVCALVAMMVLVGGPNFAATPKRGKTTTHKTSAGKTTRIPEIVYDLGDGYYGVSTSSQLYDGMRIMNSYGKVISPIIKGHIEHVGGNHISVYDEKAFYFANLNGSNKRRMGKSGYYIGDGLYSIGDSDNGYAIYDISGKIVVPKANRFYDKINEGLIVFQDTGNDKYGAISASGKVCVAPEYDALGPCTEGYIVAYKGDKCGVIDRTGKVVIPFKYDVQSEWDWDGAYTLSISAHKGMVGLYKDEKWGVVDLKGNIIVPFEYDEAVVGSNGTIRVDDSYNITQIYFDSKGRKIREDQTRRACSYNPDADYQIFYKSSEGEADKYGYMNRNGKVIIPAVYEMVLPFNGQTTLVKKDGAWHLIDRNGKIVKRNVAKRYIAELIG